MLVSKKVAKWLFLCCCAGLALSGVVVVLISTSLRDVDIFGRPTSRVRFGAVGTTQKLAELLHRYQAACGEWPRDLRAVTRQSRTSSDCEAFTTGLRTLPGRGEDVSTSPPFDRISTMALWALIKPGGTESRLGTYRYEYSRTATGFVLSARPLLADEPTVTVDSHHRGFVKFEYPNGRQERLELR